ncbi:NAD(P)-dependent oxidoreductase [Collinsella tanakaei]|uniref:NAD(P)-dependent oxidoreductase n=1 Tax=Collinsella tanakaei TaxID=626935 RepID=UPI00195C0C6C|nr:NAD(P)-dependent oxidoreductase [Collinsella tanakaei]MBM6755717.1 NAD(P)-dependent oxidoreductase [Collinsella tanakaei]MBM6868866.1 NAD(P)-dependent oxidoreductase [Collinsella tanakaei]
MAVRIVEEANRCLQCKRPLCQKGCPVSTNIPEAIRLFKEGDMTAAGEMLFENNPFSLVCSMVCNHEAQCEGHCVRGRKETPVHFSAIETFISDLYLDRMIVEKKEPNGHRAAVIGAGPAGLTVAMKLAQEGCAVTVFDSKERIGGVMRYGIPEFRLPRTILDRYARRIEEMGVKFRACTTIGGALEIGDLFRDGYEAVFVGTGVWRPRTLGLEGESFANVHFSVDYLSDPSAFDLGENVAVIGVGNSGMDVARTALRHGARHVRMFARTKHVTASSDELAYAQLEGAELVFGKAVVKITEEGPLFRTAIFDENDKVVGYEDELDQVHADSTIIAISQGPKNKLLLTTPGLECSDTGLLLTDEHGMTTVDGVFAAGDVVTGSKNVVSAVAVAKDVATAMLDYMAGK